MYLGTYFFFILSSYYFSQVTAPIHLLESFLDTTFEEYSQFTKDGGEPLKFHRAREYSLPIHLAPHISSIFLVVDIPPVISHQPKKRREHKPISSKMTASYNGYVTPSVLNSYYSITSNTGSTSVAQDVYATIGQTFSPSDLATFQSDFGLPSQPVATDISE